jgi:hypothetical protein
VDDGDRRNAEQTGVAVDQLLLARWAPLLIASATAALFRGNDPVTVLAAIATVPIFLWELSLGVWLVVKGFKPSPITTGMAEPNVAA